MLPASSLRYGDIPDIEGRLCTDQPAGYNLSDIVTLHTEEPKQ